MSGARDQRMAGTSALAVLAVALCLHPLVSGAAWFVGCVVVVAVVAGTGVGVRRATRSPVAVLLAQAAALVVVLTVLFVRESAVLGLLPGPQAFAAFADLVRAGTEITAGQGPPVDADPGVLLLVAFGIGVVALCVDTLAVTLRRPAIAGLPLLAVYCVPSAILFDRTPWIWFALAAGAYLLLLAAEGGERVRSWGRVLSGERTGAARVNLASATGARQVAAAAIGLAVLAPALLPSFPAGLSASGILPWDGPGGSGEGTNVSRVNPILDLRRNLSERSDEVVLEYTTSATRPEPLRIVVDEEFDGVQWQPTAEVFPPENTVQGGLSAPPGLDPGVRVTEQTTRIQIGPRLDQTYLPLPYPARRVDIEGAWLYSARTLDVLGRDERTPGLDYDVTHLAVQPTPQQLDRAPTAPTTLSNAATALPQIPDVVRTEARRVAGTGNAYEQAVRLQQWFRSGGGFTYSTTAPGDGPDDGSLDVMTAFLAQKRGYCVHFASTMAVMARSLGIPARVAVGFLPGESLGDGSFQVRFRDAHAWPELYFDGVGWLRFEPTPAVQTGPPPSWTIPPSTTTPTATPSTTTSASQSVAPSRAPVEPGTTTGPQERSVLSQVLDAVPWRWVVVVLGFLALGLVPRGLAAARRAWRWRSATTRVGRAEAAWDELRAWCTDLGIAWPASATPRAVRDELVAGHELSGAARDALGRLLADLETARYAPASDDAGRSVADLRGDVRRVADALAGSMPAAVRRQAAWLPRTAATGVDTLDRVEDVSERIR